MYKILIIIIIILLLILVRKIVSPIKRDFRLDFEPYPGPPKIVESSCGKCSPSTGCKPGCGSCTKITRTHIVNGKKFDPGYWCMKSTPKTFCSKEHGEWLYGADGKWKCICKNASLYSDSKSGCTKMVACYNESVSALKFDQSKNKLINGKCSCVKPFINLPGDPYRCHLDPCYKSTGYNARGLNCVNGKCSCSCLPGMVKDKNGLCVQPSTMCKGGTWNEKEKRCNCPNGIPIDTKEKLAHSLVLHVLVLTKEDV